MNDRLVAINREVSYALRNRPQEYGLELDARGFVGVDALLDALRAKRPSLAVTRADLDEIIAASDKRRHEIVDGRIRAIYGHSMRQRIEALPAEPPDVLYHGTSRRAAQAILREGLKAMTRQYVHLSADTETALSVGARHDAQPVLLRVDARAANAAGLAFYEGNDKVWLADAVPPEFIEQVC